MSTSLTAKVLKNFETRIQERSNTKLVHLIMYLDNPSYLSRNNDLFGEKIIKARVEKLAVNLWDGLYPEYNDSDNNSNRTKNFLNETDIISENPTPVGLEDEYEKLNQQVQLKGSILKLQL